MPQTAQIMNLAFYLPNKNLADLKQEPLQARSLPFPAGRHFKIGGVVLAGMDKWPEKGPACCT
ncbi:hypothetical protein [Deinococcus radiophilus]|uniref:hypothetical protein n=1 Tax=Deinococcus radiophilus TaxID=32062 RepID=UPI0036073513